MHQADMEKAEAKHDKVAESFFSQYANLLSTEQRILWEKIVEKQIDTAICTDLNGWKHLKAWVLNSDSKGSIELVLHWFMTTLV